MTDIARCLYRHTAWLFFVARFRPCLAVFCCQIRLESESGIDGVMQNSCHYSKMETVLLRKLVVEASVASHLEFVDSNAALDWAHSASARGCFHVWGLGSATNCTRLVLFESLRTPIGCWEDSERLQPQFRKLPHVADPGVSPDPGCGARCGHHVLTSGSPNQLSDSCEFDPLYFAVVVIGLHFMIDAFIYVLLLVVEACSGIRVVSIKPKLVVETSRIIRTRKLHNGRSAVEAIIVG